MPSDSSPNRSRPVLPVLLIGAALIGGWLILRTGPSTQPVGEKRAPKIVRTQLVTPANHEIFVTAHGTVVPAHRVTIEPQVTGNVIRLHPQLVPGGQLVAGDELFAVDPTLTELDIRETSAEEQRARANLQEAERKWDEGQQLASENVIAVTELASLESTVRIQDAELQRILAQRSRNEELLNRHRIIAPFNAVVLNEAVELGQRVSPGDNTVTLVGTDEFHVRAALPVDQLKWILLPKDGELGAAVRVIVDTGEENGTVYSGHVTQLQGDLEETGRMAKILINVKDPLQRTKVDGGLPLLLGSYVRVEIEAGTLRDVVSIDRTALRDNRRIWVVDSNGRLQIRDVNVRWRKDETIYIDPALKPGETMIVSELRVALPEMEVEAHPIDGPKTEAPPTQPES
jgi:RND family efflux transporter MFP subunit